MPLTVGTAAAPKTGAAVLRRSVESYQPESRDAGATYNSAYDD